MVSVIPIRALRSALLALLAVLVALFAAGCDDSPTAPSSYAPYSQTDLVIGSGATAAVGNTVTVDYTGWLYDPLAIDKRGVQFDTSLGRTPLTFVLGAGQLISGVDKGVTGMNVGGIRRLVVPPSLAYGASRNGIIPPNATLVFEVQLLEVQ